MKIRKEIYNYETIQWNQRMKYGHNKDYTQIKHLRYIKQLLKVNSPTKLFFCYEVTLNV